MGTEHETVVLIEDDDELREVYRDGLVEFGGFPWSRSMTASPRCAISRMRRQ